MNELKEIEIALVKISPHQPRTFFDEEQIESLAISIRENGLVQPITIRKMRDHYELIAGERRLRACKWLGYTKIPAYEIDASETISMNMSLIENIQREDLSAIEEAKAYLRIMQLNQMTQGELAKKLGKSQPSIANKIRLLNLDMNIQNAVEEKLITERHARALISLSTEKQNELLEKIVKKNLTVAQTEALTKPVVEKPKSKSKGYARDIQIGINTIKRACEMIEKNGLHVTLVEVGEHEEVKLEIQISKK